MDRLLQTFLTGNDDHFRRDRFKMIPKVRRNEMAAAAVVSRPSHIGKKLEIHYIQSPQHLEVQLKVCSSPQSVNIFNFVKNECGSFSLDLAFLIEGKNVEELPERVLACLRVHNLDLSKVVRKH